MRWKNLLETTRKSLLEAMRLGLLHLQKSTLHFGKVEGQGCMGRWLLTTTCRAYSAGWSKTSFYKHGCNDMGHHYMPEPGEFENQYDV